MLPAHAFGLWAEVSVEAEGRTFLSHAPGEPQASFPAHFGPHLFLHLIFKSGTVWDVCKALGVTVVINDQAE